MDIEKGHPKCKQRYKQHVRVVNSLGVVLVVAREAFPVVVRVAVLVADRVLISAPKRARL